MKLNTTPRLNADASLVREMREHAAQVNLIAEGRMAGSYNAQSAAPTTGEYMVGDFVRNSAPSELGSPGSKYVVLGWMCIAASPLAFVPIQPPTGN